MNSVRKMFTENTTKLFRKQNVLEIHIFLSVKFIIGMKN